jgi:hypothetical protein
VFRVLGPQESPDDEEEAGPVRVPFLVGRDEEVGLLRRRWEQSKEGLGQVVLLSGEAGIGKSALMQTLREHVSNQQEHTMRDHLRRYRAIREVWTQGYPGEPTGTVARHLTPWAALINGIVARKSTQRPNIALHVPAGKQLASRVKRFASWVRNTHLTAEGSV